MHRKSSRRRPRKSSRRPRKSSRRRPRKSSRRRSRKSSRRRSRKSSRRRPRKSSRRRSRKSSRRRRRKSSRRRRKSSRRRSRKSSRRRRDQQKKFQFWWGRKRPRESDRDRKKLQQQLYDMALKNKLSKAENQYAQNLKKRRDWVVNIDSLMQKNSTLRESGWRCQALLRGLKYRKRCGGHTLGWFCDRHKALARSKPRVTKGGVPRLEYVCWPKDKTREKMAEIIRQYGVPRLQRLREVRLNPPHGRARAAEYYQAIRGMIPVAEPVSY